MIQEFDKRNENIKIWINGKLLDRMMQRFLFLIVLYKEEMLYGKGLEFTTEEFFALNNI